MGWNSIPKKKNTSKIMPKNQVFDCEVLEPCDEVMPPALERKELRRAREEWLASWNAKRDLVFTDSESPSIPAPVAWSELWNEGLQGPRDFSWEAARLVYEGIVQGMTIKDIWKKHSKTPHFPKSPSRHAVWLKKAPGYQELINEANKQKAFALLDRMVDIGQRVEDEDLAPGVGKVAAEIYEKAVNRLNPDLSDRPQVGANVQQGMKLVFNFDLS